MTKNGKEIRNGIMALTHKPYEVVSGTVVTGSIDEAANTISVLPSGSDMPIVEVLLMAVSDQDSGLKLVPKDGSHVIIGSIDGPGQWVLLTASELMKARIKIGAVVFEVDETSLRIECSNTHLDIGTLVRVSTAGESLHALLNDLITAITALTVGTSTGPSTVPVNVASFSALLPRLNNLLSA